MILKKKKMIKFITMIMVFLLPLSVNSNVNAEEGKLTATPIAINAANFPDTNFRNYIISESGIDNDSDSFLSEEEIQSTTTLAIISKNIVNLQGIEYFTELTSLMCDENQLTNLDVSKNTALTFLGCKNNQLTSLDVSKHPALEYLYCENNQLTSLDVSKNPALINLFCENTQLTSLDVSKNPALENLYCTNNQLTSLDVSKNTALMSLDCQKNNLISLYLPTSATFYGFDISNQNVKEIYMDSSGNFDLSSLDSKIDASKISNLSTGASLNGTIFSSLSKGNIVGYSYDSGSGQSLSASLKVIGQTYPVVVNDGTGSKEYLENDIVSIKADDVVGKRFKEWQINSGSITLTDKNSATTTFTMPAGNVEVTAIYEDALYPVVVNSGTGSKDYIMDDVVTIKADAPAKGKQFKEWQVVFGGITLDNPNNATTTFTMPAGNVEVTAIYEDILYPVVVNGGTGSNDHKMNDVVTIKANVPAKGKQFKEWQVVSGDIVLDNSNNATTTFTMPGTDVEVTATYEDILYPVVVNGGTGSKEYNDGETVTIKANIPAKGKQFKEWQVVSGDIILDNPNNATTTFTMPAGNVEVTAIYEDVTITSSSSDSSYQIGSGKNLTYKCSSPLEDFVGIYMNNELIDASHYTLKSGSTIVTLESSYLDTLTVGKHIIKFEFKDAIIAETELTIKVKATESKPEEPITPENKPDIKPDNKPSEVVPTPNVEKDTVKTGDQTSIAMSFILMVTAGTILTVVARKRHNKI